VTLFNATSHWPDLSGNQSIVKGTTMGTDDIGRGQSAPLYYTHAYEQVEVEDTSTSRVRGRNKNDHGERVNYKLATQPFYHRQRNGKMKAY